MKTKPSYSLLILPLLCWALPLWAQSEGDSSGISQQYTLQDVVVTGQYKPQRASDAVQRIRVIDSRKIAAMGAQNLRDVLLNEMNVSIGQDNVLGSSVSIQGISGQNVKILVDGVPVIGRQNGNIDVSQLNVYNVERIELVEGPMSVNYGTDALAGTINIITKSTVKDKVDLGVNTYTESIGKYNVNANAGFKSGKHTLIVSGSRNFFDGWDPTHETPYLNFKPRLADTSRALQWDTKEEYNASLQYTYRHRSWKLRYKSDYFYDIITNRGLPQGYYQYSAFDDYYRTRRWNNTVFADAKLWANKQFRFIAAYNVYRRLKNTYQIDLTSLDDVLGVPSDQDTSAYTLFNSRATLSSASFKRLNYELGYDVNMEKGLGQRIQGAEKSINDYAIYASTEYRWVDSLVLRLGLRYAYNSTFSAPLIPSLHLKYPLSRSWVLRASYARGFRSPNIKELYFEFKDSNHDIVGNENLVPESSNNYNVAATYSSPASSAWQYTIEVAAFFNSISNMISLAQPDTNIMRYTYVNIDRFKTQGSQLNIRGKYKQFSLTLGASYVGRYNQLTEEAYQGVQKFSYSPEFRLNLAYSLPRYGLQCAVFWKYTGAMQAYGLNTDNQVLLTRVDAYSMADCSVTKTLMKEKLTISLGCKNLFNTTNINRVGAVALAGTAHSASSSSVSISTGRSLFLGLGYQFHHQ